MVPGALMDALLTDVDGRTGVAALRALGHAGLHTVALGSERVAAGRWSRHAAATASGPSAVTDPAGFVRRVGELAREHGPLVVYSPLEEGLDALVDPAADLPPEAILPYENPAALAALRDKRTLAALAESVGLAAPATLAVGTAAELARDSVPAPCVVKAAHPEKGLTYTEVVEAPEQLQALLARLDPDDLLLVQERAREPLVGLTLVVGRDGEIVSWFQQESRRTWPPDAGGSTLAVSVPPDPELVARSARLLSEAGYFGLAQLQFLTTAAGPGLIDVNPRFYGSLPLALAAGVNPAAAWHAVVTHGPLPPPSPYRIGVVYRWLEGELTAALRLGPGHLLERHPRPRAGAMWAKDDPLPGMVLGGRAAWRRVSRRLPGRSSA